MSWKRAWKMWGESTETYVTNGEYSIFKQPYGERNGMVYVVCRGEPMWRATNIPMLDNCLWQGRGYHRPVIFKSLRAAKLWCEEGCPPLRMADVAPILGTLKELIEAEQVPCADLLLSIPNTNEKEGWQEELLDRYGKGLLVANVLKYYDDGRLTKEQVQQLNDWLDDSSLCDVYLELKCHQCQRPLSRANRVGRFLMCPTCNFD